MEQLTIAGLIILVVATAIKEFFSWFKAKSLLAEESRLTALEVNQKKMLIEQQTASKMIEELHDWHDKSDQDGVKIWYIRQSLENILRDNAQATAILAKNSELQSSLLKEMIEGQKSIMKEQMLLSNAIRIIERNREE